MLRRVIGMRLNEAAARGLGYQPFGAIPGLDEVDAGELAVRMATAGLARDERGGLIVPGLSFNVPDFAELTYRETQRNSWHLDDHPAIHVDLDDEGAPHISYEHQLHMLKQGVLLSRVSLTWPTAYPTARRFAASPARTTPTESSASTSSAQAKRGSATTSTSTPKKCSSLSRAGPAGSKDRAARLLRLTALG